VLSTRQTKKTEVKILAKMKQQKKNTTSTQFFVHRKSVLCSRFSTSALATLLLGGTKGTPGPADIFIQPTKQSTINN
jgi:hypothetical protein